MKTATLIKLPDCDRCVQQGAQPPRPARYDSPIVTLGGTWGYLCHDHMRYEGNKEMATKLIEAR